MASRRIRIKGCDVSPLGAETTLTCATGPAGRLVFVGRELRDGLRRWRRRRRGEERR